MKVKKSEIKKMIIEEIESLNEINWRDLKGWANNHDWSQKIGLVLINSKNKKTKPIWLNKDKYKKIMEII